MEGVVWRGRADDVQLNHCSRLQRNTEISSDLCGLSCVSSDVNIYIYTYMYNIHSQVNGTKNGALPISLEKRPCGKKVTLIANVTNPGVLIHELKGRYDKTDQLFLRTCIVWFCVNVALLHLYTD